MKSISVNQTILLHPPERLDASGGRAFQQQVAEILPEQHNLWVIDMSLVDFVDSSGLFELVAGLRVARQQGCRLVICNLKATVRLIFEITQLDRAFEIFESYDGFVQTLVEDAAPLINIGLVAA